MKKIFVLIIAVVGISTIANSQWQHIPGPDGGNITCIEYCGSHLYAGTSSYGVYASTDSGATWHEDNIGFTKKIISTLYRYGNKIIAGCADGVYIKSPNDEKWIKRHINFYCGDGGKTFTELGNKLFVGTTRGVLFSIDSGYTWTIVNNGLVDSNITKLLVKDTILIAATFIGGVYISYDKGLNWTAYNNGLSCLNVFDLALYGNSILAATSGVGNTGLFKSSNNGLSWVNIQTECLNSVAVIDSIIYTGSVFNGISKSVNSGANWSTNLSGVSDNERINCIEAMGNRIFAGSEFEGIYISQNNGNSWQHSNSGISSVIKDFTINGSNIFVKTDGYGLYKTTNSGLSWTSLTDSFNVRGNYPYLILGNSIYLSSTYLGSNVGKLFMSTNSGVSWSVMSSGVSSIAKNGSVLFTTKPQDGVYYSINNGQTWSRISSSGLDSTNLRSIVVAGSTLYALTDYEIFKSTNTSGNWSNISSLIANSYIYDTYVYNQSLYIGTMQNGIYYSHDHGISWNNISDPNNANVLSVVVDSLNIFVGNPAFGKTYHSRDHGASWNIVNTSFTENEADLVLEIKIVDSVVYILTRENGLWKRPLSEINSIPEISLRNSINIYPNPAEDKLFLNELGNNTIVFVYDIQGNLVKSYRKNSHNNSIDISSLSSGVYILKLLNNKEISVAKFIKK